MACYFSLLIAENDPIMWIYLTVSLCPPLNYKTLIFFFLQFGAIMSKAIVNIYTKGLGLDKFQSPDYGLWITDGTA